MKFIIAPADNTVKATVEGGDFTEAKTVVAETKLSKSISQIGFSRTALACTNGSYTIEADDLLFSCVRASAAAE